jgi:hypothetical protein
MKATEFCKFFEFTLVKKHGYDEDARVYNYMAVDDQGVFSNRYVYKVSDLADKFDSMIQDYIETDIEIAGFDYDSSKEETYYEQALDWCKANRDYKDTDTCEVIACLVNPELLEDDLEVVA